MQGRARPHTKVRMIDKIISGGETGAERAALDFAIEHGIPHGGCCPEGRLAEDGVIEDCYILEESTVPGGACESCNYIGGSQGTVVISLGLVLSYELRHAISYARKFGKPVLHISRTGSSNPAKELQGFVQANAIRVLNVAGPRRSQEPGVGAFTRKVLNGLL